jgi:hypothetical protein
MSELSRKEHVFRDLIGGTILLVVAGVAGHFTIGWKWVTDLWNWITHPIETSRWWYAFLVGFFVVNVLVWLIRSVRQEQSPDFHQYTEDTFFGITWRWTWGKNNAIENLSPFCLRCDRSMRYGTNPDDFTNCSILIGCNECRVPHIRGGTYHDTLVDVRNEIWLKVRKNIWPRPTP